MNNMVNDPIIYQHYDREWEHSIHKVASRVFTESRSSKKPTGEIALKLAEELSYENHPIFGHRGEQIIKSLIKSDWLKK